MPKTTKDQSYSEKFAELEEIVAWFDGDVQDLDQSIEQFERGVELSKEIKKYLNEAENKVTKIKESF